MYPAEKNKHSPKEVARMLHPESAKTGPSLREGSSSWTPRWGLGFTAWSGLAVVVKSRPRSISASLAPLFLRTEQGPTPRPREVVSQCPGAGDVSTGTSLAVCGDRHKRR